MKGKRGKRRGEKEEEKGKRGKGRGEKEKVKGTRKMRRGEEKLEDERMDDGKI